MIHILDGFNQIKIREILQGFQCDILNDIGGVRGRSIRGVEEGDIDIGVSLSISQLYAW